MLLLNFNLKSGIFHSSKEPHSIKLLPIALFTIIFFVEMGFQLIFVGSVIQAGSHFGQEFCIFPAHTRKTVSKLGLLIFPNGTSHNDLFAFSNVPLPYFQPCPGVKP